MEEKHEHGPECNHDHEHNAEEQRKMLEAQIMQQQLMEIENQLTQIETKKQELQTVVDSIDSLKDSEGADLMVPIGVGVLAKAKLTDDKEFLVNIGSSLVVKKNAEETKELVKKQIMELDKAKELFEAELKKMIGM